MQLHLQTWSEVETYLSSSKAIIMPIGSTEQHGPNGLVGTDAICAEVLAKGIGEKTGAMVGPTINVGMAQHHMAFPGSMTLRPSTLIAVIKDYVDALARHGFEAFYFVNGHGGNIPTIKAAFDEIYTEASVRGHLENVRCDVINWWVTPGIKKLSDELFPGKEGYHATPSEVSLTYYAYPEAVKTVEEWIKPGQGFGFTNAKSFRANYPDGRMASDPSLASVEHGKTIYETSVSEISEEFIKFRDR